MECAKNEDTSAPTVSITDSAAVNSQKPEENASTTSIPVTHAPETIVSAGNDESVVVDCETSTVLTTSVIIDDGNPSTSEDNQLNVAMASATLSDADEVIEDLVISNKQKVQETANEIENPTINNTIVNPDIVSEKTLKSHEELNSSMVDGEFEDAHEYVDSEDKCAEKEQLDYDEELLNNEESLKDEGEESVPEPVVPVPVDDDTNDPQYIPRRGRFYEHDDRMAYSTTSSEESESDESYEEYSGDSSTPSRIRRRHTSSKKPKATTPVTMDENTTTVAVDGTSTKKVLAISKVAATQKDTSDISVNSAGGLAKKPVGSTRKSRDIDSLNKWTHDLYDEREQTRKSRDELLASYGYDILEESEAPRARRHHKYGRAATAKYTRSWQDTKAYTGVGQQSPKVKHGQNSTGGPNKNRNKSKTSDEYTSEFPPLNKAKPSDSRDASTIEYSTTIETSSSNSPQPLKSLSADHEKKTGAITTGNSRYRSTSPRATKYANSSTNHNYHQEQLNGGSPSSSNNKNFFNRPSIDSPIEKENNTQANQEGPTGIGQDRYSNYNRRPQQQHSGSHIQNHGYRQQHYNNPGGQGNKQHHQYSQSSSPRGRNFHQHHNNQQQYNRDRYFAKGSGPPSLSNNSNQQHYDQHHNATHTTAGTGRTQHSSGHFHHYNNQHYENDNQQIEPPSSRPVVRSSKRYSVQSRRELPDPVLNFGGMSKTPQPPTHNQQQNGLVIQEQQQTIQQIPQQIPQQQIPQQGPPPIQLQQYHPPLQQIHHGMVLDHSTGMMVMASTDPSMYHHQLYTSPQYSTGVPPNSAPGGADDPNAAAAAAAALQMLAAQAAVYQPVPTGATGITPPPAGAQSLHQPSESFMTTYYQPQLQQQKQPPPRRVNLAIPIVAPPPETNLQQGIPKPNPSPTPTAASTN